MGNISKSYLELKIGKNPNFKFLTNRFDLVRGRFCFAKNICSCAIVDLSAVRGHFLLRKKTSVLSMGEDSTSSAVVFASQKTSVREK